MTITLTDEKKKMGRLYEDILVNGTFIIRLLSKLIGNLMAAFPAVSLGAFY